MPKRDFRHEEGFPALAVYDRHSIKTRLSTATTIRFPLACRPRIKFSSPKKIFGIIRQAFLHLAHYTISKISYYLLNHE